MKLSVPSFYREAYLAVTDFDSYRRVFEQSLGKSLLYLLYLSAHWALVLSLAFSWLQLPDVYRLIHWARDNFPPLEIHQGELRVQAEQPLVKKYLGDSIYTFVFDTTGGHEPLYRFNEPAVVFTGKNLYLLREGETHTWPWTQLQQIFYPSDPFILGRKQWEDFERWLKWIYFPLIYSMLLTMALVAKAIQAVFLTFFAMSAGARHGVRLPFRHYYTIALYSLTPAVVIELIVAASGQDIPYLGIISLAMAAIYAYLATHRCVVVE